MSDVDENKAPVCGARVYNYSDNSNSRVEARTNWLGNFTLTGLL